MNSETIAVSSINPRLLRRPIPMGFERCDLSQFENWRSLTTTAQSHGYVATDSKDGSEVVIHVLPWLKDNLDSVDAISDQLRLIHSVFGKHNRLRCIDFECERPYVVLHHTTEQSIDEFIAASPVRSQLAFVAELLYTVSQAFQSRLYHGNISTNSIRAIPSSSSSSHCFLDYLDRFYTAPSPFRETVFDLYQSDAQGAIHVASYIVGKAIAEEKIDLVIQGRKLAILKSMLRKRSESGSLDDAFDEWLEYFDEWIPEGVKKKSAIQPDSSATQEVEAFRNWNSVKPDVDSGNETAEVGINKFVIDSDSTGSGTAEIDPSSVTTVPFEGLPAIGSMLGRYRLEKLLGRGGMGAVYRGLDSASGAVVAIKVLQHRGQDSDQAVRRFKKEARILASVRNEHVTQLFEVGVAQDVHYIAMEFVDGVNLKEWMSNKLPLDERTALKIIADVTRALVEAHNRRIIHRDIKPENVLLAVPSNGSGIPALSNIAIDSCVVKLTDFGIARQIEQSESMEVTKAGSFLGTPRYMSPEQCKGGLNVDATTDVYSLGITLYELLTGNVPFLDSDAMKLAAMHCFDPVPDLRKRNNRLSDPTVQLVHRMLSKNAADRFANATQLLAEIQRILDGKHADFDCHPHLPEFDRSKLWERVFEWDLKSDAESLWPHVTNTDRLNRAAGLPAVEYRITKDPVRGIRRFGSFKLGGVKIEWEEHPFEWIEGSRMGVVREFSSGPFKWFMNTVELKSKPEGGTKLIHKVQIEPRNTLGRVISTVEAGWKGGKALDRIYNRIDESIQTALKTTSTIDPFENSTTLSKWKLSRIEARADEMIKIGSDVDAAHKLIDYVKSASPQELAKIRPISLAKKLDIESATMLDTCLLACKAGLLVMQWDILCPTCRVAARSESILSKIKQHTECESCDTQFQSNIGNAIELVFRVHQELRDIETGKFCIGGPWHAPHVVTQIRVAPGEHLDIPIKLEQGEYFFRSVGCANPNIFSVRSGATEHRIEFNLSNKSTPVQLPTVQEGYVTLSLGNELDVTKTVRLERTIEKDHVVTAATVSTLGRFRELFPDQSFSPESPITSEDMSLLALQINNMDELYSKLGDESAYELTQMILGEVERTIIENRGALVKSTGEGVFASFQDCASACQAAIAIQTHKSKNYSAFKIDQGICVHRGRTLIAQQNGRLDYFGASVRKVTSLATKADNSLFLTDSVHSDPVVCQLLIPFETDIDTILIETSVSSPQIIQRVKIR